MQGKRLAHVLRVFASSLEKLDDDKIDEFVAYLKMFGKEKRAPEKLATKKLHAKVDPIELERLMLQLNGLPTREAGAELLDRSSLNRKDLERMAKLRDLHVSKDDTTVKIKEKLVEVAIGSRLSSRAIRGQ